MKLLKRCVVLFLLGFTVDLLQTLHIQGCSDRNIVLSVSTILAIYVVGFWGHDWFIQHKDSWSRWWITVSGAMGAGAGTAAVMIWDWI